MKQHHESKAALAKPQGEITARVKSDWHAVSRWAHAVDSSVSLQVCIHERQPLRWVEVKAPEKNVLFYRFTHHQIHHFTFFLVFPQNSWSCILIQAAAASFKHQETCVTSQLYNILHEPHGLWKHPVRFPALPISKRKIWRCICENDHVLPNKWSPGGSTDLQVCGVICHFFKACQHKYGFLIYASIITPRLKSTSKQVIASKASCVKLCFHPWGVPDTSS